MNELYLKQRCMMAVNTLNEIYQTQIKTWSVVDRLQLVRLIMDDLAESAPRWIAQDQDSWSQQDLVDVTTSTLLYEAIDLDE
ncbi:MAG: hypothetical protein B6D41_00245 [Chloroflexi bacterium UTCFX4]|nr:MAG: hypothetical protein B6D41_00245 [Chloroflexi bacterium UTCFX4]